MSQLELIYISCRCKTEGWLYDRFKKGQHFQSFRSRQSRRHRQRKRNDCSTQEEKARVFVKCSPKSSSHIQGCSKRQASLKQYIAFVEQCRKLLFSNGSSCELKVMKKFIKAPHGSVGLFGKGKQIVRSSFQEVLSS